MDGRKRLVFVLKDDVAATIVIPVDVLSPVDYKRLKEMEAKGGELMKTMRDTKLDNGRNALELYKNLIVVTYKPGAKALQQKQEELPVMTSVQAESAIKRGRGRPRKNSAA